VRQGNVAFADGNLLFNRSGMTVSQTAEVIAEILHGVSFGERTEGVRWRRIETPAKGDSRGVSVSRA
jgi:prepilin-type processing-associated H-X9-DG protein